MQEVAFFSCFRPPRLQYDFNQIFDDLLLRFFIDFGFQNPSKIDSKKHSENFSIFQLFFYEFGTDLGPILEPSWPILAPCWPAWRLLGLLLAILGAILAPRWPPGAKRMLPDPLQTSIFIIFLIIFRSIFTTSPCRSLRRH